MFLVRVGASSSQQAFFDWLVAWNHLLVVTSKGVAACETRPRRTVNISKILNPNIDFCSISLTYLFCLRLASWWMNSLPLLGNEFGSDISTADRGCLKSGSRRDGKEWTCRMSESSERWKADRIGISILCLLGRCKLRSFNRNNSPL